MVNFEDNEKLVWFVYNKSFSKNPSRFREDLIQEGRIALFKATQSFKEGSGCFSTYATKCIFMAMYKFLKRERKHNAGSLDEVENCFSSGIDTTARAIEHIDKLKSFEAEFGALTERNKDIVKKYMDGEKMLEIAKYYGLCSMSVSRVIKKFKKKCLKRLENDI